MKFQIFDKLEKEDIALMKLSSHEKDKLKKVYQSLMKKYHPDKNHSINAANITQEIIDLYNFLLNKNIKFYDSSKEIEQTNIINQNINIKLDDIEYIKKIIQTKNLDYFRVNYLKLAKIKLSQFEYSKTQKNIKFLIDNFNTVKKDDININDLKIQLNGIKFSDMLYSHICFEKAYQSLEKSSLIDFTKFYIEGALNSAENINHFGEKKCKESINSVLLLKNKFTIFKKFKYIFFKMNEKEKNEILELVNKIDSLNTNFIYQDLLISYINFFI